MTLFQAIVLGAVQGLTEFLPVSSSGHLVIFQHIFAIEEAPLTFDVLVHLGTLIAVFIAFWDDILGILKKPFCRLTYLLIVGCIPAGLAGFLLAPYFEKAFDSLLVVGIALIFTGILLSLSENLAQRHFGLKQEEETAFSDALFIGILQALAIVPGLSRSGSTIAAGLMAGLDREFAARFSFLLSIPVIIGAGIFELSDVFVTGIPASNILPYTLGPLTAALFGLFAIKVVLGLVRKGKLAYFSYYCWILAVITLCWYNIGK
ncbi:MAG: undecaprenyl-diphosphatase UppP [Syntrophomonas sp.]|uniref:undecaprenyl-diphosphatase UppP n=1 Tax=Syntrophomonas sp. TaxID=2053627 RepID=UPI00260D3DC5|nr:undecaprenyl-diphosphatase UppP [Syntrophomonas sp.]MDD2509694.1 undecaprenyl-diphosphatase UppP [Syntrophomonas sp.]MDD3879288.1 undecaprenyl-diphosphatase UppP [Syntrophomonas sp.]MDD4625826.1 undecaprenyl-diphosphatase UppP [Syntrophomonas sp.]